MRPSAGEKSVSGAIYRRNAHLLEAEVGTELVALDPAAGLCFGFNEVAARVWERLAEPASLEQICDELEAEFEVDRDQCLREVQELLDDMEARQLIERSSDTVRGQ